MACDVSIIFSASDEGRLCHSTLQSIFRALSHAEKIGIRGEVITILDQPTQETSDYFSYSDKTVKIKHVQYGDSGLSCNYGVQEAKGKYVFFLRAGDLFSACWITKAYKYLEQTQNEVIVHTEYYFCFGKEPSYWKKQSSFSPKFILEKMVENNCWDSCCAAKRSLFMQFPFSVTIADGFFFKEWHLYCNTLAAGIEQHVIPETAYFSRETPSDLQLSPDTLRYRLLPSSSFFDAKTFPRLFSDKKA